jgi:hypothetical protein
MAIDAIDRIEELCGRLATEDQPNIRSVLAAEVVGVAKALDLSLKIKQKQCDEWIRSCQNYADAWRRVIDVAITEGLLHHSVGVTIDTADRCDRNSYGK